MAFYHLSCDALQRSNGRSSVAAVAYITGSEMHDERQDMSFDYSRKERVLSSKTILPDGAAVDASKLWNAVEKHHKRGDAVTARTIEIALPHELGLGNKGLVDDIAKTIAEHYGVGITYALHQSSQKKNIHAHFILSACSAVNGIDNLGKKVVELDPIHCKRNGIQTAAEVIRPYWQDLCNKMLEDNEIEDRIDHRSHKARGLITKPQIHIGYGWDKEYRRMVNEGIRKANEQILIKVKEKPAKQVEKTPVKEEQKPMTIQEAVDFIRRQMYAVGVDKASEKQIQHWRNELATIHNKLMLDTLPKVREHMIKQTKNYDPEKRAYFLSPDMLKQDCQRAVIEHEKELGIDAMRRLLDTDKSQTLGDRGKSR